MNWRKLCEAVKSRVQDIGRPVSNSCFLELPVIFVCMCGFYLVCFNPFEKRMEVRYAGQITACSRTVLKSSICDTSRKCQAYLFPKNCLMAGIWSNCTVHTLWVTRRHFVCNRREGDQVDNGLPGNTVNALFSLLP